MDIIGKLFGNNSVNNPDEQQDTQVKGESDSTGKDEETQSTQASEGGHGEQKGKSMQQFKSLKNKTKENLSPKALRKKSAEMKQYITKRLVENKKTNNALKKAAEFREALNDPETREMMKKGARMATSAGLNVANEAVNLWVSMKLIEAMEEAFSSEGGGKSKRKKTYRKKSRKKSRRKKYSKHKKSKRRR